MADTAGNVTKYSYGASNQLTGAGVYNSSNTQMGNYAYSYDGNGNQTGSSAGLSATYN